LVRLSLLVAWQQQQALHLVRQQLLLLPRHSVLLVFLVPRRQPEQQLAASQALHSPTPLWQPQEVEHSLQEVEEWPQE
jgi:hypothetical protein